MAKENKEELQKKLEKEVEEMKKINMQIQHLNQKLMEHDREAHRLKSIIDYLE